MHDWNTTTINGAVQSRTHGPAHELLTMAGAQVTNSPRTLTYDTKGNMTTDDRGCGMTWDFDNMLQSFAANGVTDLKNATYEYDAIGRRVAKNVGETGGTQTTVFVQAGQQVTCEYTPGNATTDCDRKYAYGTYIDEVLNFVDATTATEARYWLSQNRQYSVYTTTVVAGFIAERIRYDAYGKHFAHTADGTALATGATICRVTFTGRGYESEMGMLTFRSRWYHQSLGRFLTPDTLAYIDGFSRYVAYFASRAVDPFGTACQAPDCEATKTAVIDELKKVLDFEVKKHGCKAPKVNCCPATNPGTITITDPCYVCFTKGVTAGGTYNPFTKEIYLCPGNVSDDNTLRTVALEEIRHYLDRQCTFKNAKQDCSLAICIELRGKTFSGECDDEHRAAGVSREDCLKKSIKSSVRLNMTCKGKTDTEIDKLIENAMSDMYCVKPPWNSRLMNEDFERRRIP